MVLLAFLRLYMVIKSKKCQLKPHFGKRLVKIFALGVFFRGLRGQSFDISFFKKCLKI